jgi:hypothetical protein
MLPEVLYLRERCYRYWPHVALSVVATRAAPLVQRTGSSLQRFLLPGEVCAQQPDVLPADWLEPHDQFNILGHCWLPSWFLRLRCCRPRALRDGRGNAEYRQC